MVKHGLLLLLIVVICGCKTTESHIRLGVVVTPMIATLKLEADNR